MAHIAQSFIPLTLSPFVSTSRITALEYGQSMVGDNLAHLLVVAAPINYHIESNAGGVSGSVPTSLQMGHLGVQTSAWRCT